MALTINNAILHVIDSNGTDMLSNQELDTDSEICYHFIGKHVRRLLRNPEGREACFSDGSEVYAMIRAYQKSECSFKDFSRNLCERLSGIMRINNEIPSADILVVDFEYSRNRYLAILKLNYIECFTHKIDDGANHIIVNNSILPVAGGKVEEACLIPYDPMVLRVLEKPILLNDEETYYFSKYFLDCEAELSKKELADIITQTADDINQMYFDGDIEAAARFSQALISEATRSDEEDDNGVHLETVIKQAFEGNEKAATDFLEAAKDAGLPYEVKIDQSFAKRQFGTKRFKADNGIEIKFPSELMGQPETIQFVTNPDGSVSVTMRNLRRID